MKSDLTAHTHIYRCEAPSSGQGALWKTVTELNMGYQQHNTQVGAQRFPNRTKQCVVILPEAPNKPCNPEILASS